MKKNLQKVKQERKERRHKRIRAKIFGTFQKPRLSVFRSLKHIYVQLINDEKGKTLVMASDQDLESRKEKSKKEMAKEVGKLIAKRALEKKINQVVFDRGSYKYHGRIRALAEGVKEGKLKF